MRRRLELSSIPPAYEKQDSVITRDTPQEGQAIPDKIRLDKPYSFACHIAAQEHNLEVKDPFEIAGAFDRIPGKVDRRNIKEQIRNREDTDPDEKEFRSSLFHQDEENYIENHEGGDKPVRRRPDKVLNIVSRTPVAPRCPGKDKQKQYGED